MVRHWKLGSMNAQYRDILPRSTPVPIFTPTLAAPTRLDVALRMGVTSKADYVWRARRG